MLSDGLSSPPFVDVHSAQTTGSLSPSSIASSSSPYSRWSFNASCIQLTIVDLHISAKCPRLAHFVQNSSFAGHDCNWLGPNSVTNFNTFHFDFLVGFSYLLFCNFLWQNFVALSKISGLFDCFGPPRPRGCMYAIGSV